MVLGLTGGIACGKSTLVTILQGQGWQVIETDVVAHELMAPGQENHQKVIDLFGAGILNPDQTVNRRALGELVFSDPALLQQLNQAVHPAIRRAWSQQKKIHLTAHPTQPLVIVIPLLFELELASEFDTTACIACRAETQGQRLRARGLSEQQARARVTSQQPLSDKIKASNFMIWNEGSKASLEAQSARLPR